MSRWSKPTSVPSKPLRSTKPTRPASDSDTPLTKSGEALPRMRKRAGVVRAIRQHSQEREEVRLALNLVNDHQAGKLAERVAGSFQAGQIQRVFEVEVGLRAGGERLGQGGFAALARAEQGGDPEMGQGILDLLAIALSIYQIHS